MNKIAAELVPKAFTTAIEAIAAGSGVGAAIEVLAAASDLAPQLWANHQETRIRKFLAELYDAYASDEGFAVMLAAVLNDPKRRAAFLEEIRTAVNSVADEVLSAIALLHRDYERTGRAPDSSFRDLCSLLQQLGGDEYRSFRAVIRAAWNLAAGEVALLGSNPHDGRPARVFVAEVRQSGDEIEPVEVPDCDPALFPRLSRLLFVHNLGDRFGGGEIHLDHGEPFDEVRLRGSTVRWVAQFLVR